MSRHVHTQVHGALPASAAVDEPREQRILIIVAVARVLAWLGGAAFVGSLTYTAYFYAVVLGQPPADPAAGLPIALAVDLLLFTIFALHHSLFAREAVKRAVQRVIPPELERSFYVWLASGLLLAVCLFWQRMPGVLYQIRSPMRWLFHIVQAVGLVLTWRAAGALDPLELAGIRQVSGVKSHTVVFRTTGAFGLVRHPIYLGWILMVFGAPLMTMDRFVFAAVSSLYLVMAIPWEERSLVTAFGDRYRTYQSHVRWRLIPGVW